MSKYDAVYNFIKQYEPFNDILYFNSIQELVNIDSLNAIGQDDILRTFTSGKKERRLTFSIIQMQGFDESGISDINLTALANSEALATWLRQQNSLGNFPNLGEGRTVQSIEVAQSPYIGDVTQNNVAKYIIQFQIFYTEEFTT